MTPADWRAFAPWVALETMQLALEDACEGYRDRLAVVAEVVRSEAERIEALARGLDEPIPRTADLLGAVAAAARFDPLKTPPAGLDADDFARVRRAAWSLTDSRHGPMSARRARTTGGGVAPWWPELRTTAVEAIMQAQWTPPPAAKASTALVRMVGTLTSAVDDFAVELATWTPPPASKYLGLFG